MILACAIALYIAAITSANLIVATFGPWVSPINAFFLIGLDLTLRDWLHVRVRHWQMLALTDKPQDYRQLASATRLPAHVVKTCLSNLVDKGLAKNHAASGQRGQYTLPAFAMPQEPKGWCDV